LLRAPAFSASLATYMLGTFVGFGAFVFVAQYLQLVVGLSPLEAGVWTLPWPLAFVAGSMLTPMIARHVRPAFVVGAGLVIAAMGFGLLTRVEGTSGSGFVVIGSAVMSLGLAPVFTLATDIIVGTAPPEQAGAASALSETSSEFGGALGIAVLGSIGTAVYRSQLADTVPIGVPADAATVARATLGGAVAVAGRLPEQVGAELLRTARDAFAQSFELAAGISADIALGTAIVATALLRHARAGQAEEPV
jgi:MFS transporter, DHA2 family, multidrug resistance protein